MRNVTMLGALIGALFTSTAWAGLANLAPPANWAAAAAGATERGTFRAAAANAETWLASTVRTTATLNVGGELTQVPAGFRMAANAGRFAGRFAFGNPILFATGAIAVPLLLDWLQSQNFSWDDTAKSWKKATGGQQCTSNCLLYTISAQGYTNGADTPDAVCQQWLTNFGGSLTYIEVYQGSGGYWQCKYSSNSNHLSYVTGISTSSVPPYDHRTFSPATQQSMETALDAVPVPDNVANEIAGKGGAMPVADPVINPWSDFTPQPLHIPQGLPQPVPNTNPQQYKQPALRVTPAPVPLAPWQVDVTPEDLTDTDPTKLTLTPNTTTPNTTPTTSTTPKDQTQLDLCQAHPEILACQKLGDIPQADQLRTRQVDLSITPDSGWDFAAAACPAPRSVSLHNGLPSLPMSFQPLCDFASGVRPIVIGVAWLAAAMLFLGIGRKGSA